MKKEKKSAARRAVLRFGIVCLLSAALLLTSAVIGVCRRLPEGGEITAGPLTLTRIGYERWLLGTKNGAFLFGTALPDGAEAFVGLCGKVLRLLLPAAVRLTLPGT